MADTARICLTCRQSFIPAIKPARRCDECVRLFRENLDRLWPLPVSSPAPLSPDEKDNGEDTCPHCGAAPKALSGNPAPLKSPALPIRFTPNFGEQAQGIEAVILPLGDYRAIERLARDLVAFGYGMGESGQTAAGLDWLEKAEKAKAQLLENVRAAMGLTAAAVPAMLDTVHGAPPSGVPGLSVEERARLLYMTTFSTSELNSLNSADIAELLRYSAELSREVKP